jgi:hypothetical protein
VYILNILFEHRFWLQILGDHSRFLHNSLSPNETDKIAKAKSFIGKFDNLLYEARKDLSTIEIDSLTMLAYEEIQNLRQFKLQIITEQLVGKVEILLPPTFINHMVNELEEYLFILNQAIQNKSKKDHALNYHLLWLSDGVGHADSISSNLDLTEKLLIKEAKYFSKIFESLYLKAVEFCGYTRTGLSNFPALDDLNFTAEREMLDFKKYLEMLLLKVSDKKTLGTIAPLILDHMNREECYYLTKLASVSKTKIPDCDPTKSRVD